MQILEDKHVQNYMKKVAEKFYEENTHYLKLSAMDVEDLIQETYLGMIDTINKHKDFYNYEKIHQMKLLCKGVVWHLQNIVAKAQTSMKGHKKENIDFMVPLYYLEKEGDDSIVNLIEDINGQSSTNMKIIIEDMKNILDDRAFIIVIGYIIENKTFKELSEEIGLGVTQIKKIYDDNILKLKNITKKEDFI